ncbi:MAG: hypothetical protein PUA61_05065 [Succinatimonas hippei]|nr:hypothetical protein [Succinatimonas hippei]
MPIRDEKEFLRLLELMKKANRLFQKNGRLCPGVLKIVLDFRKDKILELYEQLGSYRTVHAILQAEHLIPDFIDYTSFLAGVRRNKDFK